MSPWPVQRGRPRGRLRRAPPRWSLTVFCTLGLVIAHLGPFSLLAHAGAPIVLTQGKLSYHPGNHLEYLEDASGKLGVEDVTAPPQATRFTKSPSETPNFGFTKSSYWYRFDVQNPASESAKMLLEIAYAPLDRIEMFLPKPGGGYSRTVVGDTLPHGNKPLRHFHFVLPVSVEAGQRLTVLLRVRTLGSMQLPLRLWTSEGLRSYDTRRLLVYGVYFGIVLAMLVYNLFLFVGIRDRSYLYYVTYIAGSLIYSSSFAGFAQEYLWSGSPWLCNKAIPVAVVITNLGALLFARRFLATRTLLPRWNKPVGAFIAIHPALLVGAIILPYNPMIKIVALLVFPSVCWVFGAGVLAWRAGYRPARYFLTAWVAFLGGIFAVSLNKFGLVPMNPLIESSHEIGFALNVVLLSFGLADRINTMRREKEEAQREALETKSRAAETLEREVERKTRDLRQKTCEAVAANKAKSEFFANVSHELRTPLTLIATPLQRLLAAGPGAQVAGPLRDKLTSMAGNAQRLLRLVNQLLDFSRIESGGATVALELRDVRQIAESVVAGFEPFARSKGLTLELRGPADLPPVPVDPPKLDKVLCNLLSNACKFTERGGTVVLRLEADAEALRVVVRDTGIGIAEADQPRIFERFRQVDSAASRRYEGTGIGLALARELTELMGGALTMQSELGVGTTFTLSLPLQPAPGLEVSSSGEAEHDGTPERAQLAAQALAAEVGHHVAEGGEPPPVAEGAAPPRAAGALERAAGDGERPLVLVVEDNRDMRALIREICEGEFRIVEAADGQAGLDRLAQERPALVISDIMMPGMDGQQLLQRIRACPETATLPVMLLTAKAGDELRLEGLASGADDYLIKPFESRELLARARNLVRLQRQERELRELTLKLEGEVVRQASALERARSLQRYLPPQVVRAVIEEGQSLHVEQQRRRITVLRLELRGFDELLPLVEPEDIGTMVNSYLSEMAEAAFDAGATVDHLARDRVTVFFGAPTSEGAERDAQRAARLALELWQRAVAICERWSPLVDALPAPTGVLASGHATVGNFGSVHSMAYTAIGGPVDDVDAMLPSVGAGELVCSQSTWTLANGAVPGEPCGESHLRHRSRPINLYRLAGPLPRPRRATSSARGARSTTHDGPPAAGRASIEVGSVLAGRYEVLRQLGEGGMGVVFHARDRKLSLDVALKLLRHDVPPDPALVERMYHEVKLARLVSHPNVARIFDLGECEGREFISMEFIRGHTLSHRILVEQRLCAVEACDVMCQLCSGLAAAHAAGIVHRDLKPSNIMLERGRRVVILDFGIARWFSSLDRANPQSQNHSGTPFYMAPEQLRARPADHRADIYSLGLVAYEIFTGRRPFEADDTVGLAWKRDSEAPPDPLAVCPELPPRIGAVILRCLEKDPANRFDSVAEILRFLPTNGREAHTFPRRPPPGPWEDETANLRPGATRPT